MRLDIYIHDNSDNAVLMALAKLTKRIDVMTEASGNLAREVAETRAAVTALTGRYQAKIDQMQVHIDELTAALANGDTEAATAAAADLDALQTEMAALGAAPAEPPAEPPVEG